MRESSLQAIFELARRDERVVFIGSDLGAGVLADFRSEFPKRFFMEGIQEQHVIGMAAGLAMDGYIPFVNTIATFLTRRCFEQLAVDLSLQNLDVRLLGYGGGTVYAPLGPTHMATNDIGIVRTLPNFTIVAPCDAVEAKNMIDQMLDWRGPIYIRLGRGGDEVISPKGPSCRIGQSVLHQQGDEVLIVSTGVLTQRARKAAAVLKDDAGVSAAVLHCPTIKPLDTDSLVSCSADKALVVTVEEHSRIGGLGSAVLEALSDASMVPPVRVLRLALPDETIEGYGDQEYILGRYGLDARGIADAITRALKPPTQQAIAAEFSSHATPLSQATQLPPNIHLAASGGRHRAQHRSIPADEPSTTSPHG